MKKVIAIDLGASNGRLILATLFNKSKLEITEIHRFSNEPIQKNGHLHWNISYLFHEILKGLRLYLEGNPVAIDGVGVDTWGVDFGLLSQDGKLLEDPYSYRDTHTVNVMDEVHEKLAERELFERTGVEVSSINTIYQLYAIFKARPDLLEKTASILTLPSLISYLLSGVKTNEFTHASTTQLFNFKDKKWDESIISKLFGRQLPFAELNPTNSILGYSTETINQEINSQAIPIINVPGHDTACALAGMPIENGNSAFMSCGTWVLIGIEVKEPIVSEKTYNYGFTNEGTVNGNYRLQKNNMGLWLIQQCKKEWEANGDSITYLDQDELLDQATPFRSFIDPDHRYFFNPASMTEAIKEFCKMTNQLEPISKGQVLRCIHESLVLKYRWVIEKIEEVTRTKVPSVHMGGGGIQNRFLCQYTSNALNRIVKAGPIEASAIGNAISQFIALGDIENITEGKNIIKNSFDLNEYHPQNLQEWENAYASFSQILSKNNGGV
ncbi:rhamnulokinase [Salipaludibacillus neizhouensis]|uniref:Rhamnulokinase n=1 Tax=Salipaludibacillus neizhouensis TaxID=885475 RepID=A0A3A9K992_9BACI|nr:rhamnulokinase family protein [Salipaludibacillus neizhouensis]RKL66213.1 rhamnulokinase [Salipaludibacillus neizhouensis]